MPKKSSFRSRSGISATKKVPHLKKDIIAKPSSFEKDISVAGNKRKELLKYSHMLYLIYNEQIKNGEKPWYELTIDDVIDVLLKEKWDLDRIKTIPEYSALIMKGENKQEKYIN